MSSCDTLKAPSYRLHKSSGQAVVTLGGRDFYLGENGGKASREKYDRLVAEWLASGRRMVVGRDPKHALTITELAAAYWRHAGSYYRKDGRPTVEIAKLRVILKPLRHLYGRTPAAEFGPLRLKAIRDGLVVGGNSRRYINDQIGRLKRMYRWGVENELVSATVYQALCAVGGLRKGRSEARETGPIRPVAESRIHVIRPFVSQQVWAIIQLQELTGMRPGEVVIMRRCDLDTSGDIWLYKPASHKTEHFGQDRIVDLGPQAQAVIKPFLRSERDAYFFSPKEAVADFVAKKRRKRKSRVQPSQHDRSKRNPKRKAGDRYTVASYRRAIQRACDLAWPVPDGMEDPAAIRAWKKSHRWHPHQLRHSYATRIRKDFGVEAARILLGHRSTAVTELYAEIDRGRVRDIVSRVG